MRRALKIVAAILALIGATLGFYRLANGPVVSCYKSAMPTCYEVAAPDPSPAPNESLRERILRDLVKAGKLPAKVILRAGRSAAP